MGREMPRRRTTPSTKSDGEDDECDENATIAANPADCASFALEDSSVSSYVASRRIRSAARERDDGPRDELSRCQDIK